MMYLTSFSSVKNIFTSNKMSNIKCSTKKTTPQNKYHQHIEAFTSLRYTIDSFIENPPRHQAKKSHKPKKQIFSHCRRIGSHSVPISPVLKSDTNCNTTNDGSNGYFSPVTHSTPIVESSTAQNTNSVAITAPPATSSAITTKEPTNGKPAKSGSDSKKKKSSAWYNVSSYNFCVDKDKL